MPSAKDKGAVNNAHALPHPPAGLNKKTDRMPHFPSAVIRRLALYGRVLQILENNRTEKISSKALAEHMGINSAQVRTDLAYFGQFGVPGYGYHVRSLRANLKRVLGTDRQLRLALIGAGNLGMALMTYGGFSRQGVRIVMGFDVDRRKAGSLRNGIPIYHVDDLEKRLRRDLVDIVALTVPSDAAQPLADRVGQTGVSAILNFVPCRLMAPPGVRIHDVDLTIEIECLSFYIK